MTREYMVFDNFCIVCEFPNAKIIYEGYPGYEKHKKYDIYHCSACKSNFIYEKDKNIGLYNQIYANSNKIGGYDRYNRYAKEILTQKSPINYLVDQEEVYWSIWQIIKYSNKNKKYLDVGCGLGYLTYALKKEGYKIKGLDISKKAIKRAKKLYGDHFICESIYNHKAKYDYIILAETIEHINDISKLIRKIRMLLKPKGKIIITTPNKGFCLEETIWATDLPPIHRAWIPRNAFVWFRGAYDLKYEFVNFKEYYSKKPNNVELSRLLDIPIVYPVFDKNGKLIDYKNQSIIKKIPRIIRRIKRFFRKKVYRKCFEEGPITCVVLTKPN
jgi:2-polyprenyl-3-methyl-5-hydroxy-6-metoxy-1,4-benzoquinol methylase